MIDPASSSPHPISIPDAFQEHPIMHHSQSVAVTSNAQFELEYQKKVQLLLMSPPVERGAAHAMKDDTTSSTHELMYLTEVFSVSASHEAWQDLVRPNLPWADDHFEERVGGNPLNPSPSEAWWPFARAGNAEHKDNSVFSHTYPERFWPKMAGDREWVGVSNQGIRYPYGDLDDLIRVLAKNPMSRQAYLPIWFPEDLNAARKGLRVPCSMGYHFIVNKNKLDCVYTMRSCDIVRFYRDDVYMAGRLLQWVAEATDQHTGNLILHIDNLHCFPGDRDFLESKYTKVETDRRTGYDFGALM